MFLAAALSLQTAAGQPKFVFQAYAGGSRSDSPASAAVDSQGNTYVTGTTDSLNYPRTQITFAQPPLANLLLTTDGGKTYLRPAISNPVYALISLPSVLIAGTAAGSYRSTDGGTTWQSSNTGISDFATNVFLADSRYPSRVFAGTDQGLFRSDDAGSTWSASGFGLPQAAAINALRASVQRPDIVLAIANNGVYRSIDAGQSWQPVTLPVSPTGPAPVTIATDPSNPDAVYIAGAYDNTPQQAYILKSTDGGASFNQISTLAVITSTQALAVSPGDSNTLFAAGLDGHVYRSSNGGSTWRPTALAALDLEAISFDPAQPSNLYALSDEGLYLSTDLGGTWSPTAANNPKRDMRTIFFTPGNIFLGADSGEHVFLSKWSPTGSLIWSILIGGSYSDQAKAVAVDSSGNPYLTGTTESTDFPTTPGAFQPALNGLQNIFVAKFTADGEQLVFSTYLGGSASDSVSALTIDNSGAIYLAGYATSPDFPTTSHAFQQRHNGSCNGQAGGDAYVAKLAGSSLVYSTLLGGGCAQLATGIAIDAAGDAYVAGATASSDFPVTRGVVQPTYSGSTDGFVAELTPAGDALVFSTYLGGPNSDIAAAISVDASGNVLIAGNGSGFPFVAAQPPPQIPCGGVLVSYGGVSLSIASPPYLLRLAPGAASIESLHSFAYCGTVLETMAVDPAGRIWLGGIAEPTTFDTVAPLQTLAAGGYFLRKFAPDAVTTQFSTLLDSLQSVTVDSAGAAYITANSIAPGISKELLNTGFQPSVSVAKLDTSSLGPVSIDGVLKYGTLSIPALAQYSGPLGIAPSELIVLTGHGLGGTNVAVNFDGAPATIVSSQDTRIVCSVPASVAGKQRSTVQATSSGVASNAMAVTVTPSEVEVIVLVNQDGTVNSSANPAPAGSYMTLYASGLGAQTASVIFNSAATITYQGQAPGLLDGITQINFVTPKQSGQSILSVTAGKSTDYVYVYTR